jgi:hypothetical protein
MKFYGKRCPTAYETWLGLDRDPSVVRLTGGVNFKTVEHFLDRSMGPTVTSASTAALKHESTTKESGSDGSLPLSSKYL